MSIMDRLKKSSKLDNSAILSESKVLKNKDVVQIDVPMINVALSGQLDGGLQSGLTVLAGPSKHFKTSFAFLMAGAYLRKHPDAVMLFYDSEFGSPDKYFKAYGIDKTRVFHTPIMNIEQLKFDLMSQLENIDRNDRVIIVIDSIGNLASKKEVEDALKENTAADMTRAKQLKSVFRMATPYLAIKDIPMLAINHTYQTQEMFSKAVVSGGCMVAGTKIWTLSGLKNIENIEENEIVYTLDGEKLVTHIWDPETLLEGIPECYEVEFEDGYVVTVSENHQFLTADGWVKAKDLLENSRVINIDTKQLGIDICKTST